MPPQDPILAQVEADISGVEFRTPVVDEHDPEIFEHRVGESNYDYYDRIDAHHALLERKDKAIDREWLVLTEAARRAINESPDVRAVATRYTSEPLSELLPSQAANELREKDPKILATAESIGGLLAPLLELEPVPDAVLNPDVRWAPIQKPRADVVDSLLNSKQNYPEYYDQSLKDAIWRVETWPGVTPAEKRLVARRYTYGRDVKLLGLMAELHDQPIEQGSDRPDIVTHTLKSGTKLVMTGEAYESSPELLNPQKWEGRRQLKDRVYSVRVDGKDYIMKERKTARHTDTLEHGHKDGLTSKEEFEVAREFAALGTVRHGDIALRWEKPLGYVEFPDGYQFCMFEREPKIQKNGPGDALTRAIMESPDEYKEEFDQIQQSAKEIYHDRQDLLRHFGEQSSTQKPKRFALSPSARRRKSKTIDEPQPDELTFEEFAGLKAYYMIEEAREEYNTELLRRGYIDGDGKKDYAFNVRAGSRPTLELFGFDFEYYEKNVEDAASQLARNNTYYQSGLAAEHNSYHFDNKRRIVLAASYAIMDNIGWKIPPKED